MARTHLWRVVAAEMPASFEPEALKAQTVAARTYTLSKMERTVEAHPDADVCTDITCCQAYIDPADAAANWGENAQTYEADKIAAAVADTDGMVGPLPGPAHPGGVLLLRRRKDGGRGGSVG
ncbi:MAG: SpoIID/LytB domain-containing protein [Flavonifractor plautii]